MTKKKKQNAACTNLFYCRGLGGRQTISIDMEEAATQVFAWLGRRGSGKTYGAGALAERLLIAGVQVIVVDVVGTWWGLRAGAEGEASGGFDIPVLGGDHGDIELLPEGGAVVASMLVETGSSAVLDLSGFRKGSRQKFLTDWAEEFFHDKKTSRTPVHVILEEAHTLVPQRAMHGQERMLGAMEDLVRLGRNYGIGISMLDQRPQSVHKDVLNQAEVLCAFQLVGAQERDAVRRWAEAKEQPAVKEALSELAKLPSGECILWSPEWLKICNRVKVGAKQTYDASATPSTRSATPVVSTRAIDLELLAAAMKAASKPAVASGGIAAFARHAEGKLDPKKIEAAYNKAVGHEPPPVDHSAKLQTLVGELRGALDRVSAERDQWRDRAVGLEKGVRDVLEHLDIRLGRLGHPPASVPVDFLTPASGTAIAKRDPDNNPYDKFGEPMPKMARAFLTALAQLGPLTRAQLLAQTGYRASGDVSKMIASMLRAPEDGGAAFALSCTGNGGSPAQLSITDTGLSALGHYDPLPVHRELWNSLIGSDSKLSTMERKFLDVLGRRDEGDPPRAYGRLFWRRATLLAHAGYKSSGDTSKALAKLVLLGYAEKATGGLMLAKTLCDPREL